MAYKPDLSDAGPSDSPFRLRSLKAFRIGTRVKSPTGAESSILIRDTWNTDILEALTPRAGDAVLYKHRYSGFYETELDAILKRMGVKYLVFTGCTTSICVESTIRDARFRDYVPHHGISVANPVTVPVSHRAQRSGPLRRSRPSHDSG